MPILLASLIANSTTARADGPAARTPTLDSIKSFRVIDADGDGLDDLLERGVHISPFQVDSDGDEWNDAEEFARGSLAGFHCSQPESGQNYGLGARAYMRDGRLHAVFAVYLRTASLSQIKLDIGVRSHQSMVVLSPSSYISRMTVNTVPTHETGQTLVVADVVLPAMTLWRTGSMSIFGKLRTNSGLVVGGDSINLVMADGIPIELVTPSMFSPGAEQQLGDGLIHRPLGGSTPPANWTSGQICFQRTEAVGTHGAVVTQEVTTASCIDGFDGHCDGANCGASVGTTVDLVDPAALVGG